MKSYVVIGLGRFGKHMAEVNGLWDDLSGLKQLVALNLANCKLSSEEVQRIRAALGDKVAITF